MLGNIMDDTSRTNRRVQGEFWRAAEQRLQALPARAGARVRDSFSTGVKADVQAQMQLPYSCPECTKRFGVATQVSDHLRSMHNIIKHASLINPDKQIQTIEEGERSKS